MKASEIDWNKAPEGAMYYLPENDSHFSAWVKKGDDDQWMAWLADGDTSWDEDDSLDEVGHLLLRRDFIRANFGDTVSVPAMLLSSQP